MPAIGQPVDEPIRLDPPVPIVPRDPGRSGRTPAARRRALAARKALLRKRFRGKNPKISAAKQAIRESFA